MNLAQLRDQPHLSVSSISDYIDCGLLFKFGRIDKLVPEFKADALVFGTAIHAVLAEFYEELKTGQKMSAKQLQEIFAIHWHRLALDREDIKYKPDKDYDTLLLEGKELLSTFHQKIPEDEGEIIGIEQAFQFWLDGLPIPISELMTWSWKMLPEPSLSLTIKLPPRLMQTPMWTGTSK